MRIIGNIMKSLPFIFGSININKLYKRLRAQMLLEKVLFSSHQIDKRPNGRIFEIKMPRIFVFFKLFEEVIRKDELFYMKVIFSI